MKKNQLCTCIAQMVLIQFTRSTWAAVRNADSGCSFKILWALQNKYGLYISFIKAVSTDSAQHLRDHHGPFSLPALCIYQAQDNAIFMLF